MASTLGKLVQVEDIFSLCCICCIFLDLLNAKPPSQIAESVKSFGIYDFKSKRILRALTQVVRAVIDPCQRSIGHFFARFSLLDSIAPSGNVVREFDADAR